MTLEETPDAFEAALAANAADVAVESAVEETVEVEQEEATSAVDSSVDSDEDPIDGPIETDEDDPNAEFRRTLRAAIGDWYVVHSYAGYEKKVKGNLANRTISLNMEDYIFQIEVPEEEVYGNQKWSAQDG